MAVMVEQLDKPRAGRYRLSLAYLLLTIPSGLILIFFDRNPSVNDYHAHWERARQVASGIWFAQPSSDGRYFGGSDAAGRFVAFNHTAINSPFAYFPSLFSGGNFRAACVLTLLCCSIITAAAIAINTGFRHVFLAVALLPSYFISLTMPTADAVSNSVALLFISYCLRLASRSRLAWGSIGVLTVMCLALGQLKTTLVCFLLILILVGYQKTIAFLHFDWRMLIPAALGLSSFASWSYLIRRVPPTVAITLDQYQDQKSQLFREPVQFMESLIKTLLQPLDLIPSQHVNGRRMEIFTGMQYTQLPPIIMVPILFAFVLLICRSLAERGEVPANYRIVGGVVSAGYYVLTVAAMLAISTVSVLGQATDGMQGRYMIPLIPLICLLLPDLGVSYGKSKNFNRLICTLTVFSYIAMIMAHVAFTAQNLNKF